MLGVVQRAMEQQERLIALTAELEKGTPAPTLHRRPPRQTPKTNRHRLRPGKLGGSSFRKRGGGRLRNSGGRRCQPKTGRDKDSHERKNITLAGGFDLEKLNYFVLKTARQRKASVLQKGDLLFNWRSGSTEHVGKSAYFEEDVKKSVEIS